MKNLKLKFCLAALISLLTSLTVQSQNIEAVPEKPISKKTVEDQINRIFSNSADHNETKMVSKTDLENLRSDVLTLLSRNENDMAVLKKAIEAKNSEIEKLRTKVDEAEAKVTAASTEDDTFLLFGMALSKTLYHAIMWTLVLTLSLLAVFLIIRFKSANGITQHAKEKLTEVEEEFELYKRNAIEREQKLGRQLQNEIKRQKEMLVDVS